MPRRLLLAVALSLFLTSSVGSAQKFEITPHMGYRFNSSIVVDHETYDRLSVKNGFCWGAIFNFRVEHNFQLEFTWSRTEGELEGRLREGGQEESIVDMNVDHYLAGVLYMWGNEDDKSRPFILGNLGAARLAPGSGLSSLRSFSFGLGGGIKIFLKEKLGLRFQGRYLTSYLSTSDDVFCNSEGVCYSVPASDYLDQIELSVGVIWRF